jgi:hypothetical protein
MLSEPYASTQRPGWPYSLRRLLLPVKLVFLRALKRALQDNPDENAFVYSIRPRELRATTKRLNERGGLF